VHTSPNDRKKTTINFITCKMMKILCDALTTSNTTVLNDRQNMSDVDWSKTPFKLDFGKMLIY